MHGFIKLYALWTWNEVHPILCDVSRDLSNLNLLQTSWGSRPDGDIDNSERMAPRTLPAEVMENPGTNSKGLIRYAGEKPCSSKDAELNGSLVGDIL
jgi:hypothetical protein